jgi:hypothetical protein
MGRLAAIVAKELLSGQRIVSIRVSHLILYYSYSGRHFELVVKQSAFRLDSAYASPFQIFEEIRLAFHCTNNQRFFAIKEASY